MLMDSQIIIETIVNEPIYLSIVIIFILIIIYSILKKFFKILIFALSCLLLYIGYLIYTGGDLPGNSEEIINPLLDKADELKEKAINEYYKNE